MLISGCMGALEDFLIEGEDPAFHATYAKTSPEIISLK